MDCKRENRKDLRFPLRVEVRWDSLSGVPAITSDIGLGGCYIESLCHVEVGQTIYFRFHQSPDKSISLHGKILYQHPSVGFGVQFTDFDARDRVMKFLPPAYQRQVLEKVPRKARVGQAA